MKAQVLAVAAAIILAAPLPTFAQGYPATQVFSARQTVIGQDFAYPVTGKPVVNAAVLTLVPGEKTIVHQHGVPMFAYILEGELTVDYGSFGRKVYTAGQSFMEAINADHWGVNSGTAPVRILAVYMSADGAKDVIPKE